MQTFASDISEDSTLPNLTIEDTLDPESSSSRHPVSLFEAAGASHPGRVRVRNEDSYGIFSDLGMCAVADGLGGRAGGEVASAMAIHEVKQALARAVPESGSLLGAALAEAVTRANHAVHGAALADQRLKGMATTFVGLVVTGGQAVIAHVGDSRAYRIRGGVAERLTVDHSMRELYLQTFKARADPLVAEKNASIVTRAVGARPEVRVDVRVEELLPGDTFLLCSDGLWGLVSDEEMSFAVARSPHLETALASLIATAYNRGGTDNITAVLVRPDASRASRASRADVAEASCAEVADAACTALNA